MGIARIGLPSPLGVTDNVVLFSDVKNVIYAVPVDSDDENDDDEDDNIDNYDDENGQKTNKYHHILIKICHFSQNMPLLDIT